MLSARGDVYGGSAPEGFTHELETEPIQFGFRKMNPTLPEMLIQPNPTLIVRVGLVRVVGLLGWMYTPSQNPRLGTVNFRSSIWRLSWSAQQLGLVTRYHYNISILRILTLLKPFLPLVLPSEVSMIPKR